MPVIHEPYGYFGPCLDEYMNSFNNDLVITCSKPTMPGSNESKAGERPPENDPTSGLENQLRPDSRGGFLCGVVEGFYGRPWTTEQRKDLFSKMQVRRADPDGFVLLFVLFNPGLPRAEHRMTSCGNLVHFGQFLKTLGCFLTSFLFRHLLGYIFSVPPN